MLPGFNEGKTIHEIMAVSGHLTLKEVERYTKMADRACNARRARRVAAKNKAATPSHRKLSLK